MKFKYLDVLTKHSMTVENCTHKTKLAIKSLLKMQEATEAEEKNLANIKSELHKKNAERRIEQAKTVMVQDDDIICGMIEKSVANKVINEKRSAALQRGRDNKKNKTNATGPDNQNPPNTDPPKVDPPKNDPPKVDPPKNDPPPDVKKKSSGWGYVFGAIAIGVLAAVGINYYNNKN